MTIQLRKASFRKWLRGQEPSAVVGKPMDCWDCPLARFLISLGAKQPSVTSRCYYPNPLPSRRTPRWAVEFMMAVDRIGNPTAARCLRALEATNA